MLESISIRDLPKGANPVEESRRKSYRPLPVSWQQRELFIGVASCTLRAKCPDMFVEHSIDVAIAARSRRSGRRPEQGEAWVLESQPAPKGRFPGNSPSENCP